MLISLAFAMQGRHTKNIGKGESHMKTRGVKIPLVTLFILNTTVGIRAQSGVLAVVAVPVADLIGQPIRSIIQAPSSPLAYGAIPICGINPSSPLCPRLHQALFNEIVEIISEQDNQVQVAISNLFFITQADKSPHTTYWGLKKDFIPLPTLKTKGIDLSTIPTPLSFTRAKHATQEAIITLTQSWAEPESGRIFSAGTRFVVCPSENTRDTFGVYLLDPANATISLGTIPRASCLLENSAKTSKAAIKDFVHIVRSFAHLDTGFIPYVWGGCSVATLVPFDEHFSQEALSSGKIADSCFSYPVFAQCPVKTGLDCTGLVARAAQIAGIPYFLKNSTTVATYLDPIKTHERLAEGDIIWIPGHVMVVSSLAKNMLVEARHYAQGYGKVHEIALAQVFKDMRTYHDLAAAFHQKKAIQRLDINGAITKTYKEWKLLSLASIWEKDMITSSSSSNPVA